MEVEDFLFLAARLHLLDFDIVGILGLASVGCPGSCGGLPISGLPILNTPRITGHFV